MALSSRSVFSSRSAKSISSRIASTMDTKHATVVND
jgi:hypothetical protein